jgi:NAD(P)-dependent dehydrogenase (short-subunit alcohol dehydrogenase family)
VRVNCICPDWVDTPAVARSLAASSEHELGRTPKLVPAEEIASLVLGLIRDDSLAGRVLIRPVDGKPELMPVEGPCG